MIPHSYIVCCRHCTTSYKRNIAVATGADGNTCAPRFQDRSNKQGEAVCSKFDSRLWKLCMTAFIDILFIPVSML